MAEDADDNAAATATPAVAAARRRYRPNLTTFRSLSHRNYRLLWISTLFASGGLWIQQITLGWVVHSLTDSAFLLGAINGVRSLPLLLLAPFGGVAADRIDRRRLMLASQLALLLLTTAIATIIIAGKVEVWHLFVFATLTGIAWSFDQPVRQSVVPSLVPREDLMNAMALSSTGFNATRIIGPAIAGILVAALGAGENFYLQALTYIGVIALIYRVRIPAIPRQAGTFSVLDNVREGAAYVWRHPTLRVQMALALVPIMIALPYQALMPIFADEVLGRGASGFGIMMSAVGVGAVIGTLTIASLSGIRRKGLLLISSIFLLGVCLMLFALSRNFYLSIFLLICLGALFMAYMTTNQTLIHLTVTDELRGRVMGIYMINQGMMPLGSLLAGTLADFTSAPTAVFCMGAAVALLAIAFGIQSKNLRAA